MAVNAERRGAARFETIAAWLHSQEAHGQTHAEVEARPQVDIRELARQLEQDHLDQRAQQETRLAEVIGADGVRCPNAETGRDRDLATIFGPVAVQLITYRKRGHASLHPADAALNLPEEKHSHGPQRRARPPASHAPVQR